MPSESPNKQILKAVDIDEDLFKRSLKKARQLKISWSEYVNKTLENYLQGEREIISKRQL